MKRTVRLGAAALVSAALALGACSDEDVDSAERSAEDAAERVKEGATEAREGAEDAFATFRTGYERLIDEASSGDNEAREELLDQCRDALEEMRKNNDPRAEQMGALCQRIRDADEGNAWQEIREEYEEVRNAE